MSEMAFLTASKDYFSGCSAKRLSKLRILIALTLSVFDAPVFLHSGGGAAMISIEKQAIKCTLEASEMTDVVLQMI